MSRKISKSNGSQKNVSTVAAKPPSNAVNYQGAINGAAIGANLCKHLGHAGLAVGMSAGGVIGYLYDK